MGFLPPDYSSIEIGNREYRIEITSDSITVEAYMVTIDRRTKQKTETKNIIGACYSMAWSRETPHGSKLKAGESCFVEHFGKLVMITRKID
jgi:hypothetical protein